MKKSKRLLIMIFIMMLVMLPMQGLALFLADDEIFLESGATHQLMPMQQEAEELFFISTDPRVATVDADGLVTAVGKGAAQIYVRTMSGMKMQSCKVYVDLTRAELVPKVHFYQGDAQWDLPQSVKQKGCVMTSVAMLLKNSGIETDPADFYAKNGGKGAPYYKVFAHYDVQYACALAEDSAYLLKYNEKNGITRIKNRSYDAAIREALELHPEGVLCYFVNAHGRHAIVAMAVEDGVVYYSDPGRVAEKGEHVPFEETWCAVQHGMEEGDLAYMIAIDA